jgi:O-antigen ligase
VKVEADASRLISFGRLLCFFAFFYPLVLFPGTIGQTSSLIGSHELASALEQNQLLPKILFLLVIGILGLLSVRRIAWREPVILMWLVYFGLVLLSTLNARDPSTFVWIGPSQRLDGFLYQLALVLFGITAYQTLRSQPQLARPVLVWLLLGGAAQSLIILLQRLGLDFVGLLVRWEPYSTPVGTLSHSGMVAGFLLPIVLVGMWLYQTQPKGRLQWVVLGSTLLVAVGLGITGNRAAFYALLATLVLLNVWYRHPRILLLSLAVVGGLLGSRYIIPNYQTFEKSYNETYTLQTRLIIWQMGLEVLGAIPGQPLIGGGPEAFKTAQAKVLPLDYFQQLYPLEFANSWPKEAVLRQIEVLYPEKPPRERSLRFTFREPEGRPIVQEFSFYFDKAHMMILDHWLAYGLIAALIWVALYLVPLLQTLRRPSFAQTGLGWALLAVFIYYLGWFPVVQTEPSLVLLLMVIWSGHHSEKRVVS